MTFQTWVLIVDANQSGASARFNMLKSVIEKKLNLSLPTSFTLKEDGLVEIISEELKIGIWIMPNNKDNGYLEHFVAGLVPNDNETWAYSNKVVDNILKTDFCEFSNIKEQKARIHTYLALQREPGKPLGLGIAANYFDAFSENANSFVSWFTNTFELAK